MMWTKWREALIWAVLAAACAEFGLNLFSDNSLWHRMERLEQQVNTLQDRVSHLERIHELERR